MSRAQICVSDPLSILSPLPFPGASPELRRDGVKVCMYLEWGRGEGADCGARLPWWMGRQGLEGSIGWTLDSSLSVESGTGPGWVSM